MLVWYDHVPWSETEKKSNHPTRGITFQQYQKAYHRVHHRIYGTSSIMDFPTNTWKVPSSRGSTVSDVTGTLSSVSLLHADKGPRSITDLPSELILRIYRYLDGPSEIIALNRTSRLYYWIWRMNAASISGAGVYFRCSRPTEHRLLHQRARAIRSRRARKTDPIHHASSMHISEAFAYSAEGGARRCQASAAKGSLASHLKRRSLSRSPLSQWKVALCGETCVPCARFD